MKKRAARPWATAGFCLVRGLPVLIEGWRYFAGSLEEARRARPTQETA